MTPASAAELLAVVRTKLKKWADARKDEGKADADMIDEAQVAIESFLEDVEERMKRGGDPAEMKTGVGIDGLGKLPLGVLFEHFTESLQTIEDEYMREVPRDRLEHFPKFDRIVDALDRVRKVVKLRENLSDEKLEKLIEKLAAR